MKTKITLSSRAEYPSFWRTAFAITGSVTPRVTKRVICIFIYACVVVAIHTQFTALQLAVDPFEYAGVVLGVLMVFRVNAGYDRWWEGRKLWGSIVNQSRNIAILVDSTRSVSSPQWRKQLLKKIAATPFLIKSQLRGERSFDEVKDLIDIREMAKLEPRVFRAVAISQSIAQDLRKGQALGYVDNFVYLKMEEQRGQIIDSLGACERILKTPVPFAMAVNTRRFIVMFVGLFPFGIVATSPEFTPFVTALIAYAFFTLDQIGVEMQNPFSLSQLSHLPLTDICQSISECVLEIAESADDELGDMGELALIAGDTEDDPWDQKGDDLASRSIL
jgi:putative membrane protein